jgi:hypothetical protein
VVEAVGGFQPFLKPVGVDAAEWGRHGSHCFVEQWSSGAAHDASPMIAVKSMSGHILTQSVEKSEQLPHPGLG